MRENGKKVSIPHRYAKNEDEPYPGRDRGKVSIPHRYAKNEGYTHIHSAEIGFQFLIGTLKTFSMKKHRFPDALFQFLIGTLKTHRRIEEALSDDPFQFLIGTLKTGEPWPNSIDRKPSFNSS